MYDFMFSAQADQEVRSLLAGGQWVTLWLLVVLVAPPDGSPPDLTYLADNGVVLHAYRTRDEAQPMLDLLIGLLKDPIGLDALAEDIALAFYPWPVPEALGGALVRSNGARIMALAQA